MPEADLILHLRVLVFSILRGCTPVILIYNVACSSHPTAREAAREGGREGDSLSFRPDCVAMTER